MPALSFRQRTIGGERVRAGQGAGRRTWGIGTTDEEYFVSGPWMTNPGLVLDPL
jgi:hypothetical protein